MSGEGLIPDDRLQDIAVAPGESEDGDAVAAENKKRIAEQDEAERRRRDELTNAPANNRTLESGLEDSMDGSDPPSSTQP